MGSPRFPLPTASAVATPPPRRAAQRVHGPSARPGRVSRQRAVHYRAARATARPLAAATEVAAYRWNWAGGAWAAHGHTLGTYIHTRPRHTRPRQSQKKRPLPRHVAAGAVAPQQQQQKKKSVAVPIYLPAAVGGRGGAVGVCGGVGVAATTVRQERGRPLAGREWDRSHTRERAGLATPPPCRGHHSGGRACAPQRISDTVLRGYSLVSHSRSVRNAGRADRTSTRFHCIQLCSCHNELLCNMYFRSQPMTRCQPRWQRRWSRQLWRGPPVAASSKHIHSHP